MTGIIPEAEELFDVILSRPQLTFGSAARLAKSVTARAKLFEALATNPKREVNALQGTEQYLMPKGNLVEGGITLHDIRQRLNIRPVMVDGVDQTHQAVRDLTGTIHMDWSKPGTLEMNLPHVVTDEQVRHLSRYMDNNQIDNVLINHPNGPTIALNKPLGAQMEDALAETGKGYVIKKSRITPDLIKQYKAEGVFRGQAGVLADGSPVEIRRKQGEQLTVFDHTAGREFSVHESQMSVLPTTLEDQLRPNYLFNSYMSPEDKLATAKVRQAMATGLGTRMDKFSQLETFAGSRGFVGEKLQGGKIALVDMASGERQQFENLGAAVAHLRSINRPAPELTPELITSILGGNNNVGFVGPNGGPPIFGQTIPVPNNIVFDPNRTYKARTAWEYVAKPMRSAFQRLQERTGLPFADHFLNIQQQTVLRQNANARWIFGQGRELENNIMPLDKIRKLAGNGDAHQVTAWIESDAAGRQALQKDMTPGQIKSAVELEKFQGQMASEFGLPSNYFSQTSPALREAMQKYGDNDFGNLWKALYGDTPVPKGADFFADHIRTGMVDPTDTDAFRSTAQMLHAATSKRYMSAVLDDVSNFLRQVPDRTLTKPMSEYLEALRGHEFLEHKQMLEETLKETFKHIPGLSEIAKGSGLFDKLSDLGIGLSYMSTMGFRIPSVLRNYMQVFHTTYGIYGHGGAFIEGLGRAMTREGKLAAVEDGAISYKSASLFGRQEVGEAASSISSGMKKFADLGFKMYDNADEFTRAASYWIARETANKAIFKYARALDGANPAQSARLVDKLLLDSKAFMFEKNIQQEFLRRVAADPEQAARFLGKQGSDVTQFLYGRGMQPYWMRSVWGKFLGQYGTWPVWYLDYLTRTTRNFVKAGHPAEAVKFLGRNAAVNLGILYAGKQVLNIDLSRWLAYPALFYSGGPGAQVAAGTMQLMRGLGDQVSGSESEFAQSHTTEGLRTLAQAGQAFIPFRSFARDANRMTEAIQSGSWTEILAASLGARPSGKYLIGEQLDALFPGGPEAYEEWLRYHPAATAGPSASAISEQENYTRQPGQPIGGRTTPSSLRPTTGVGLQTGIGQPSPVPLGLTAPTAKLPQKKEPQAESTPLQR